MDDTAIASRPVDERSETTADGEPELIDELLVEEISIDGMCGVY